VFSARFASQSPLSALFESQKTQQEKSAFDHVSRPPPHSRLVYRVLRLRTVLFKQDAVFDNDYYRDLVGDSWRRTQNDFRNLGIDGLTTQARGPSVALQGPRREGQ
jgi:hypothetical protein